MAQASVNSGPRTRGRPRKFDRDAALAQATCL
ncbi:TetR/AcrR family transcriptional regulator, partial [Pseudoroseomonas wenyumeiae]